jgi:hypothetical protein
MAKRLKQIKDSALKNKAKDDKKEKYGTAKLRYGLLSSGFLIGKSRVSIE